MMKLFMVHCGYYDKDLLDGVYEGHVNLFVAAESFDEARIKIKSDTIFIQKRMHVDGLQEVRSVSGFRLNLNPAPELMGKTELVSHKRVKQE